MPVRVNESDVRAFAREIGRHLQRGAGRILVSMAKKTQQVVSANYREAGWTKLAQGWDRSPVQIEGGAAFIEVYNRAESDRIYNKTTRTDVGRVRSTRHWITGDRLISILEHGAKPHAIVARNVDFLAYPEDTEGLEQRTREFIAKNGPGSFLKPRDGEIIFAPRVDHPGVGGAHFLERAEAAAAASIERIAEVELADQP